MTAKPRRWYREPMLWLALGIPLATIAAGLETLRLASAGDGDDVEPQPVTRTAQAQEADLGPDLEAARRALQAHVRPDPDDPGRLVVDLPGVAASEGPLTLDFVHPMFAREDRRLLLAWTEGAWQARAPWPSGKWKVTLVDRQQRWRLAGSTAATPGSGGIAVILRPALAPR